MIPVIALVGRPNVGKSTLFNRLTRSRDALVADVPGLTRDRKYGDGRLGDRPFIVVDTGGLSGDREDLDALMAEQSWQAVEEADRIIFRTFNDVPAKDHALGVAQLDHSFACAAGLDDIVLDDEVRVPIADQSPLDGVAANNHAVNAAGEY